MRVAIMSTFANVTIDNNHKGIEAQGVAKILEDEGHEVIFVGEKSKRMKDDRYIDWDNVNISVDDGGIDYVMLQMSPANLFGGVISARQIWMTKWLPSFIRRGGKVCLLCNDPLIPFLNLPKTLLSRMQKAGGWSEEMIDKLKARAEQWNQLIDHPNVTWILPREGPGGDMDGKSSNRLLYRYFGKVFNKAGITPNDTMEWNVKCVDYFAKIHQITGDMTKIVAQDEKRYDLMYWGANRGTERDDILIDNINRFRADVCHGDDWVGVRGDSCLHIGMVAYKTDRMEGELIRLLPNDFRYQIHKLKRVKHNELGGLIRWSQFGLCAGDIGHHRSGVVTYRFYESVKAGIIPYIDTGYLSEVSEDFRTMYEELVRSGERSVLSGYMAKEVKFDLLNL